MDKVENLYNQDSVAKLQEMISEIKVCMFFTKGRGEKADVRPMAVIHTDEKASIWFLASKNSDIAETIGADNYVHLVFSHPGKEMYLDVYGTARILQGFPRTGTLYAGSGTQWRRPGLQKALKTLTSA